MIHEWTTKPVSKATEHLSIFHVKAPRKLPSPALEERSLNPNKPFFTLPYAQVHNVHNIPPGMRTFATLAVAVLFVQPSPSAGSPFSG